MSDPSDADLSALCRRLDLSGALTKHPEQMAAALRKADLFVSAVPRDLPLDLPPWPLEAIAKAADKKRDDPWT